MTNLPLFLPMGAARPFVWLAKAARSDSALDQPRPQRPEVTPPLAWTPGLWRRWADAPAYEPAPPPRRSSWSLTNARLHASLHQ
jgi:hypothetical protein